MARSFGRGKNGPRRVRTPGGAKLFGQPIGTIITRDMILSLARRRRAGKTGGATQPNRPARTAQQPQQRRSQGRPGSAQRPRNIRIEVNRRGSPADAPAADRRAPDQPEEKKGLPPGHRFSADPLEERKSRYLEAIDTAEDEKTIEDVLEQLSLDNEMPQDQWDEVLSAAQKKVLGEKPEPPEKPVRKPEKPDAPEAKPDAPGKDQEVEPEDTEPAKPNSTPERVAARKKKGVSAAHKKRLNDMVDNAASWSELKALRSRAKNWEAEGYIDEKTRKQIDRKIDAHPARQKAPGGDTLEEAKDYADQLIESGRRGDRHFLTMAEVQVDELHEQGLLSDKDHADYKNRIESAIESLGPEAREDVFSPGDWMHPDEDTGSLTAEQRNYLLNPKMPDDQAHARYIAGLESNPDNTPAGKELAAGKSIAEVSNPEGLEQYINAHPERFQKNEIAGGQSGSGAFSVYDADKDERHFFKRATNDGPMGMTGDGINEVLVGRLGKAAFPEMFLEADFAERPEHGGNALIRLEHVDELAQRQGSDQTFHDAWAFDFDAELKDRKQPLALHVFDYLTNQTDRNLGNIAWHADKDGRVGLVATDNAAAFSGYDAYAHTFTTDQDGNDRDLPSIMITNPEDVSYADWAGVFAGSDNPNLSKQSTLLGMSITAYPNEAELRKDVKAVIDQFAKVDIDSVIADLKRRFPNMDDYEQQHMEAAARTWKKRMAQLRKNKQITDEMMDLMAKIFGGNS